MPHREILVIGGGIGGLTLALSLHARDIPCRVYEAAPEFRKLGVGINMLPHAIRVLTGLGLQENLNACGVEAREFTYFNRHGQLIFSEPCGLHAATNIPISRSIAPICIRYCTTRWSAGWVQKQCNLGINAPASIRTMTG